MSEFDDARSGDLIEALVAECLERSVAPDDSVLAEVCRRNPELKPLVRTRIQALANAGFLAWSRDQPPSKRASAGGLVEETALRLAVRQCPNGRYRISSTLAQGGQGIVERVWDEDLRRFLARKVMLAPDGLAALASNERALARFLGEAQVTARLDHPGIVPVHELGLDQDGRVYFTMKLVEGEDFGAILARVANGESAWPSTRALGVLLKVCEAVAYAHAKGVIHRDLKPSNVMVGRFGEVFVMDWGLAHVLAEPEMPEAGASGVAPRGADAPATPPLTMEGHVLGTPLYMSPEQARGDLRNVGPHSDVYSVGAMLHELLTGFPPHGAPGADLSTQAVLARVRDETPSPVSSSARGAPPEILAICERALARDWHARYADMGSLVEDLRAYLDGRVVRAHRVGPWIELSKWIRRNRPFALAIAAGVVALAGGLGASLVLKSRSDRNAERAETASLLADERRIQAETRRNEVMRLSAMVEIERLEASADSLWPATPALEDELVSWVGQAEALLSELEPTPDGSYRGHRAMLAEFQSRSVPVDESTLESGRRSHPRYPELARLTAKVACLHRAREVRTGAAPSELPQVVLDGTAAALNARAWSLVGPNRQAFGEEQMGLILARAAVERATHDLELANCSDTLAWACLANGLDDEALEASRTALEIAPPERVESFRIQHEDIAAALERHRSGEVLAEAKQELAELEQALSPRTIAFLADDILQGEEGWWFSNLFQLVQRLEELADPESGLLSGISSEHGWGIQRRLAWARSVAWSTVTSPQASRAWERALEDIRTSPHYGGLELFPQIGLFPLGPDPKSGLVEFAFPQLGELPVRDEEGNLVVGVQSAPVFVLLPGGSFTMGAQSSESSRRNYDPASSSTEEGPAHDVELAPFLLSKYELTQAQWMRFAGDNPSYFTPEILSPFWSRSGVRADLTHPVEQVSWTECERFCRRLGLALPTEAQWEYAARAGTDGAHWMGEDPARISAGANLSDGFAEQHEAAWSQFDRSLDDGHTAHAHVGSYLPNAFGLYDVLGNVWEWCLDSHERDFYGRSGWKDPVNRSQASQMRVFRGGAFNSLPAQARSAARPGYGAVGLAIREIGLRPALELKL